jgi:TonB family protein
MVHISFPFAPFGEASLGSARRWHDPETPPPPGSASALGKPDRNGVYTVGGPVTSPILMYSEPAVYSERMTELDAQGSVVVTAILDTDGAPAGADILVPFMAPFDRAAVRATSLLRFKPATFQGQPVPVRIFVEFAFTGAHGVARPILMPRGNPIEPPIALNSFWAAYPRRARKRRLRGVVRISFVVSAEGLPADLHLIRSAGDDLDQSALRAVRRLQFKPALRNGRPVPVHVTIDVAFLLYY